MAIAKIIDSSIFLNKYLNLDLQILGFTFLPMQPIALLLKMRIPLQLIQPRPHLISFSVRVYRVNYDFLKDSISGIFNFKLLNNSATDRVAA